jgi:signal transduction histidine kinase
MQLDVISVHDDGKGGDENKHNSILEDFFTVNESRSRENTNFGLGLGIVKVWRIVTVVK